MPVLSERLVRSLRPREKKYELTCSSLRGFTVRVLPSGKKVYFLSLVGAFFETPSEVDAFLRPFLDRFDRETF